METIIIKQVLDDFETNLKINRLSYVQDKQFFADDKWRLTGPDYRGLTPEENWNLLTAKYYDNHPCRALAVKGETTYLNVNMVALNLSGAEFRRLKLPKENREGSFVKRGDDAYWTHFSNRWFSLYGVFNVNVKPEYKLMYNPSFPSKGYDGDEAVENDTINFEGWNNNHIASYLYDKTNPIAVLFDSLDAVGFKNIETYTPAGEFFIPTIGLIG